MAAYAALVSVMQIIRQLQNHPTPPISIDKQQVESLTEKVSLLQEFLETYQSPVADTDEADPLEMRVADAAYAAEDVIESYIVDNIKLGVRKTRHDYDDEQTKAEEISWITFYKGVQRVIEEMDLIAREAAEMIAKKKGGAEAQNVSAPAGFRPISGERKRSAMVGFDDVRLQLLDRLTGGDSNRQVIPIVGMGGIGKTTLAMNVFENQLIKEHFDICIWATISQDYNIRETLVEVLPEERGGSKSEKELGEKLYKHLCGRRYLVVMDDMWNIEVWDKMRFCFPDYNNGSRVLVTTRLSNLAVHLTDPNSLLDIKFLDEASSWILFSQSVYGEESFPPQLEEIGKKIANNCNGHPLAIVVIGGLLAKSCLEEYWEHIEGNLTSSVNSDNGEYCLRVMKMSYNQLPVWLKPCFLYMGVFKEDYRIKVSRLMNLWVCEGFVKPKKNKSLESVAKEYFQELVDRNLVLVHKLGSRGNVKYCKMHDLLRDVSLKEGKKQRFYFDAREYGPHDHSRLRRRIAIHSSSSDREDELFGDALESPGSRSFLSDERQILKLSPDLKLVRILSTFRKHPHGRQYDLEDVFRYVNSRYLAVDVANSNYMPSISLLWNLHTLIFSTRHEIIAPPKFWEMPRLRHVESGGKAFCLSHPRPSLHRDIVVMENLHTLKTVMNMPMDGEVGIRIPNIKKLCVAYAWKGSVKVKNLCNLERLRKLETFWCSTRDGNDDYMHHITFPNSLKKMTLIFYYFELEDLLQKIGSLPLLQTLVLKDGFFRTGQWETTRGHFPSLKLLDLRSCFHLKKWIVSESSHFPVLEELRLNGFEKLEEIPPEIGEIATLKSIVLKGCSESVAVSAKKIVEEQEEMQGEQPELHVHVLHHWYTSSSSGKEYEQDLQYLASPNFHLHRYDDDYPN